MTATEHYIREMDKAMRELHGITMKAGTTPAKTAGQHHVDKHEPIRLLGGCLLYRFARKPAA